jgi:hypothetical protein
LRRLSVIAAAAAALLLGLSGSAFGHGPEPKRDRPDHTFPGGPGSVSVAENFDVLGYHPLGGGSPHGDVYFFDHGGSVGKHAYVGTWSTPCSGGGVKVIDVNNPSRPRRVSVAGGAPGTSWEDVVVQRIGNRVVLGVGVQQCNGNGFGALALIDVTDPANPRTLSLLSGDQYQVHELDMVVRADGTALALLATPHNETFDIFGLELGGELRIIDVTNPAAPVERSNWGIIADSELEIIQGNDEISSTWQGIGYDVRHYGHSARAADGGNTAYVSYWDGGIVKLDISDPDNPVELGQTTYPVHADGDGHSMTPYDVGGQRYILQNDEEASQLSGPIVTSAATGGDQFTGIEETWAPTLLSDTGTVTGAIHDAGDGCQAGDYAGAAGKIAVADSVDPYYVGLLPNWSVPCPIGNQVVLAAAAGAKAFVSNLISLDDAYGYFQGNLKAVTRAAAGMPVVQIADIDEMVDRLRAAPAASRTITLKPGPFEFGHLRVFREGNANTDGDPLPDYQQVGEFADLPYVRGSRNPPPGTWTIHNTEVRGTRAYSSWFSHGIVALDVSNPTNPRKVGQFVPNTSQRYTAGLGAGPTNFWGVAIDYETGTIYGSDMRSGLWILRPKGAAASG